ncbi:hypothetical protein J6W34_03435 [bacterium]|nr:hypothetical protein [bacterium]
MKYEGKNYFKIYSKTEIHRMDGIKKKFNKNEDLQYENKRKLLQKMFDLQMLNKGLIGKIALFIRDFIKKIFHK